MNAKIITLTLIAFVLIVAVSGCTTAPGGTGTSGTESGQLSEQQESEALSSLDSDILSEDDTVEIGEMI